MAFIGVITGLKSEADCLDPLIAADLPPMVRCSGARTRRALGAAEELLELGCGGLVSFGLAGALSEDLHAGDLVIPRTVLSAGGQQWSVHEIWRAEVIAACEERCLIPGDSPLLGSDQALTTVFEKSAASRSSGASAVDMESHAVAAAADAAGIPFIAMRIIADEADTAIPAAALDAVRPDGSISLLPIIAGLIIRPWSLGSYLRLGAANGRAMQSLRGLVPILGAGFRFPLL